MPYVVRCQSLLFNQRSSVKSMITDGHVADRTIRTPCVPKRSMFTALRSCHFINVRLLILRRKKAKLVVYVHSTTPYVT